METKGFFRFEITINGLVSSFRFILIIHVLWVCDHYIYIISFSTGGDFRRQNLTSTDVRFWHLKSIPALKGLITSGVSDAYFQDPARYADTDFFCEYVCLNGCIFPAGTTVLSGIYLYTSKPQAIRYSTLLEYYTTGRYTCFMQVVPLKILTSVLALWPTEQVW